MPPHDSPTVLPNKWALWAEHSNVPGSLQDILPGVSPDLARRASRWFAEDEGERARIARELVLASSGALKIVRTRGVGAFLHRPTSVLFHLVPGGTVAMGFDDEAWGALREQYQFWDECDEAESVLQSREIRPRARVQVAPFLLGARPLSSEQLEAIAAGRPPGPGEGRAPPDLARVAKLPADKYLEFLEAFGAGTFGEGEILEFERALSGFGLRLPSEAEREHAARAGTSRLFPHGDAIPSSPNIGMNPFGFVDLGADAEVCADGWVPSLEGIPADGRPRVAPGAPRVVRGGAASCYPWQGCAEWTLLLCAWRGPATAHDGFLTLRPAMSL